jgi:acyl transferase domain-containing protein
VHAALEQAGVEAETISYIEAHGTATELGDPIEVASLTKAFRRQTDQVGYCAIGSVKTNIGHLDRAAGASGLIKTVLALQHGEIPASLHFQSPNPEIDFANSPFYVNTQLRAWNTQGAPRRAGVNSLGMGGTNAHIVLEEAPARELSGPSRPWQLVVLSAKTGTALEQVTRNLNDHLRAHPELNLADMAYTLQVGRSQFEQRRMLVCRDRDEALHLLEKREPTRILERLEQRTERSVAFLFPGVGEQYVGMAQELYDQEPIFRDVVEQCCRLLHTTMGLDLRAALFPAQPQQAEGSPAHAQENGHHEVTSSATLDLRALLGRTGRSPSEADASLTQTALAQPAVFVIEYALARLLMAWGIRPQAMLGYSLGEYVAACLAGVFSLEDALTLVATRAQLIAAQPTGAMLAVALSEAEMRPYLSEQISLAVINGPTTCVVAGPTDALAQLERRLSAQEIAVRRVETTHAFHSSLLEPLRASVEAAVGRMKRHAPPLP